MFEKGHRLHRVEMFIRRLRSRRQQFGNGSRHRLDIEANMLRIQGRDVGGDRNHHRGVEFRRNGTHRCRFRIPADPFVEGSELPNDRRRRSTGKRRGASTPQPHAMARRTRLPEGSAGRDQPPPGRDRPGRDVCNEPRVRISLLEVFEIDRRFDDPIADRVLGAGLEHIDEEARPEGCLGGLDHLDVPYADQWRRETIVAEKCCRRP